jgi:4a-hydroxytetrahydrobiopterin dehydratase
MATKIPRSAFAATHELPDWRIVLHAIEASFTAASFSDGAAFLAEVAQAADAVDHHPDLDLRYPGRVHVLLTSHDAGGLTERDAQLAATISELAAARGLTSAPRTGQRVEVAIDALDIAAVLPFWRAALAYEDEPPVQEGDPVDSLRDPNGIGPAFWFQQMDEPRPQRNRIHLDVVVPEDELPDRLRATLAAGGTLLTDQYAPAFWVLADAEGNEACLCTWQGRD